MHRPIELPSTYIDPVQVVLRHRSKMVLWCLFVAAVTVAALYLLPRKYYSDAKLFVRMGRENVTLDPTAAVGQAVTSMLDSRENQINSVRDMLQSRRLFETVADEVGPHIVLADSHGEPSQSHMPAFVRQLLDSISGPESETKDTTLEQATEKLAKSFGVSASRASSVLTLTCTAGSPELAQKELQAFVNAYQQLHRDANRTSGALEFFVKQTEELKQHLDRTNAALRDAKNDSAIVSIPAEQEALQNQIGNIEADMFGTAAELAATEASVAKLRKSLTELPEKMVITETFAPNAGLDTMRAEFFRLQVTIAELEAKLGESHPLVKLQFGRLGKLEKVLEVEEEERVQTTTGLNSSRQTLDLELRHDEAMIDSLRAKSSVLNEQYATLQKRLRDLNAYEVRVNELTREQLLAETNYRKHAEGLEQTRISHALEASNISSVNVVQPPSLVSKPASPNKIMILGEGFLAALIGAFAIPFCFEFASNLMRTFRQASPKSSNSESALAGAMGTQPALNC